MNQPLPFDIVPDTDTERNIRDSAYADGYTDAQMDILPVMRDLLSIARLAQYYAPGELGEFPERVQTAIERAEKVLAGFAQEDTQS